MNLDSIGLNTAEFCRKITVKTPMNELNSFMTKELSSASKVLNIFKNKQNSKYIKAAFTSILEIPEKEVIQKLFKKDKIDVRHLNDIKSAYLSCPQESLGMVKKSVFLLNIYKEGLKFP